MHLASATGQIIRKNLRSAATQLKYMAEQNTLKWGGAPLPAGTCPHAVLGDGKAEGDGNRDIVVTDAQEPRQHR